MSLLPFDALYELASLFTESMKKYPARNWEKGLSYSETSDSLLRHLTEWMNKKDIDSESGFYHDVHILWNAIVLVTMRLRGIGRDDRQLDPVSDNVATHPVKGDISNPVVPITATNYPIPGSAADNVSNVMTPNYYCANLGNGRVSVVDPVTGEIVGYVTDT